MTTTLPTAAADPVSRDLRARILEEATRLFADQGFSATSMRQLVEACACTKPSLYYYFDSKETLFREVVELHMAACSSVIAALDGETGTVRQAIDRAVEAYLSWAVANPLALRLLQRVETRPEIDAPDLNIAAARELHLQMISRLIERGIERGELRSDIIPLDCALVLAGSLSFQFELALGMDRWDRDQIRRTIDLIFQGIAA